MSANQLAERYAQALWLLAEKQAVERRCAEELKAFDALIERTRALHDCLTNPTVPVKAKQAILDTLGAPVLHPLTRNFVGVLVGNRREALLTRISQVLEAKLDEAEGRVKVQVASALPLAEAEAADCRRRLEQWLNKKVQLQVRIAPELLVGITIRIGDRLIDGSGRGQLALLRQVLSA
ncbi:MAG: ATP synthase F1 subunit delta [Lentisphaerae bacterium]|nr:ATP synthase F1 subunit delta [Lentisphaerota bacterium]